MSLKESNCPIEGALLTSIALQEQDPSGSLGNLWDSGHHSGPNELACETCSPVSRGNLLPRARISPDVLLHL